MGCRGQVKIIADNVLRPVFLYTHFEANELEATVKSALAKKWRWDDPEYLARIIFDEMIGDEQGAEAGFGIGTSQNGDIICLITLDCRHQEVIVDRSMADGERREPISFTSFIAKDPEDKGPE